jgi:outer membrane lipoprotein SlyB
MRLPARAASVLAALLGVAACAPRNANPTDAGASRASLANAAFGTIVSVRPALLLAQNTGASTPGGTDVRSAILGLLGDATAGGAAANQPARGQAVEVIIREDFAQAPISVVQANEDNFQPGERVVITRGARTRLARATQPPSPAS